MKSESDFSAWFAGPKAENGEWFESVLNKIVQDYYAWRRNYFPEDGVVVDSRAKREGEEFRDSFDDRLLELLARLKADFPFQSPRYAAHMVAEQTLPSIAGWFAAMLYNPNNVSREAAPVTVRLELEACRMICRMLGYDESSSWGHLTGGGTVANLEALWVARTVLYLPFCVADMRATLGLPKLRDPEFGQPAMESLREFEEVFIESKAAGIGFRETVMSYLQSPSCVVELGMAAMKAQPVVIVPESHHYCFEKSLDVLGIGRQSLISVRVDETFRMDVSHLNEVLDECAAKGRPVLAVVAVIGTTEEGAVDPIDKILELREAREKAGKGSFWVHADGAYGGYLRTMTTPSRIGLGEPTTKIKLGGVVQEIPIHLPEAYACDALERLGEADSITIDPHKLGYIPYPAGAICFRSNLVKPLLRQEAPYIDEESADPTSERKAQNIGVYILEGSKPGAAAASVWLSHSLIPLDTSGHGKLVQATVRNASELDALLSMRHPGSPVSAVVLTPPGSNIVCYAFKPIAGGNLEQINKLTRRIYDRFTVGDDSRRVYDQQFFVSRTVLKDGQYRYSTVASFLDRLGVSEEEYMQHGVFLLRSVLMNPWYEQAKHKGRYYLSELVEELYSVAAEELNGI